MIESICILIALGVMMIIGYAADSAAREEGLPEGLRYPGSISFAFEAEMTDFTPIMDLLDDEEVVTGVRITFRGYK